MENIANIDEISIEDFVASTFPTKKKKKRAVKTNICEGEEEENEVLSYDSLIRRIYDLIHTNNPQLVTPEAQLRLPPPDVGRVGSTRTVWRNYSRVCTGLNRSSEHLLSFFQNELGSAISINEQQQMVIQGKYQSKYFESLIYKYVHEYVKCKNCTSLNTTLAREPVSRLVFMTCKKCGSEHTVAPITTGFHAVVNKKERRKLRQEDTK